MRKILIFVSMLVFACVCAVWAVDTTQPETHNTLWVQQHGQAAKANDKDCLTCHEERVECIACHEDVAPRNHTRSWTQKNHGLESQWNRMDCKVCHKEDFCGACHETAVPMSHARAGFRSGTNNHCVTSCQIPVGNWRNTPAKNCLVCHSTRPVYSTGNLAGSLHAIN